MRRRYALRQWLKLNFPELVITCDAPDFFLSLASYARKLGCYTVHFVSPSVWAWRPGRVHTVASSVNELYHLFAFEAQYYEKLAVQTKFFSHPAARECRKPSSSNSHRLLLVPGSRTREVQLHLPLFCQTLKLLWQQGFVFEGAVAAAPSQKAQIEKILGRCALSLKVLAWKEALAWGGLAIAVSGTAVLELALAQIPTVVCYRLPDWWRALLRRVIVTPWIALPNILLQQSLLPEQVGWMQTQPQALAEQLALFWQKEACYDELRQALRAFSQALQEQDKCCQRTQLLKNTMQLALMKRAEELWRAQ